MTVNQPSRYTHEELVEVAVAAILREWPGIGNTEAEARAAVRRNFAFRRRFGPELADVRAAADWDDAGRDIPAPRLPVEIDLRGTVVDLLEDRTALTSSALDVELVLTATADPMPRATERNHLS